MNDRYQEAFIVLRAQAIAAAAAKLGRELSTEERSGIERITSVMMLESVCQSFASEAYPVQTVESDLRFFAGRPDIFVSPAGWLGFSFRRMSKTCKTITPSQVEFLRDCLLASRDSVTVYFQGGPPCADYLAEIVRRDDSRFDYMLGGHGIGSNKLQPMSLEATVERVMQDNRRFNSGGSFTVEYVGRTPF